MAVRELAPADRLPFEVAPPAPAPPPSLLRIMAAFMINPGAAVRRRVDSLPVWLSLAVPGVAFMLLFLQTGLDRHAAGTAEPFAVVLATVVGFGYGTVFLALVAAAVGVAMRSFGAERSVAAVVSSFALAYSPTLVYVVMGLGANLVFGWFTAAAFGMTGVLWAIGPLIGTLRDLSDGRTVLPVAAATLAGTLLLVGWALLGGM